MRVDGRVRLSAATVLAALVCGCSAVTTSPSASSANAPSTAVSETSARIRYVALGDSYTIGTSVGDADRWPNQLVARLGAGKLDLVRNLGVNGFTSGDVVRVELPPLRQLDPGFVTILIGVNDVVQGVSSDTYGTNAGAILDAALQLVPAKRIVAVSTPDYTVTPQGAAFGDPAQQSAGIRANNAILQELAAARGIAFVDIYHISLRAATDRSLVARDGLHPSGAQYALWVDRIAPVIEGLLKR
jgi:lysophospholipase L1-like esterase